MQALVSVCMPVTSEEHFLAEAIESVLNQSHTNLELLIVECFPPDGSSSILQHYASADSRIKHFRTAERLSQPAAYNHCLRQATGVFIKPLSPDAVLHPEFLRECTSRFYRAPGIALAAAGCQRLDLETSSVIANQHPNRLATDFNLAGIEIVRLSLSPLRNLIGEPSAVIFPSQLIGAGFDSNFEFLSDLEYWLRIILDGSFHLVSSPLVTIKRATGSHRQPNTRPRRLARAAIQLSQKHNWILQSFNLSREQFLSDAGPYLSSLALA